MSFMHFVRGQNVVEYCIDGRFGGELNVADRTRMHLEHRALCS